MKVKILCIIQYEKTVVVEVDAPEGGFPEDENPDTATRLKIIGLVENEASNTNINWIGEMYHREINDENSMIQVNGVYFEDPEWFER